MIKILHSADWHLDSPFSGHTPQAAEQLRTALRQVPEQIVRLSVQEQCDLMLLSGDLFDGEPSAQAVSLVQKALSRAGIPVFIAPGNHDPIVPGSPYLQEGWPENVHIFTEPKLQSISLPELDCRIYGAGYSSMDCPALLKGFCAGGAEKWQLGVLHGEAEAPGSMYCPITRDQLRNSGLAYLALGHIHKAGSLRVGDTTCAWPGCPMGRGYDELGPRSVLLVTLDEEIRLSLRNLDTVRFFDQALEVGENPDESLRAFLPQLPTQDHYRITLTGYSAGIDLSQLISSFPHVPNLILRDETRPEPDLWCSAGEDSLEGEYFKLLQDAFLSESTALSQKAKLAARLSRQILDGQEVKLP